MYTDRNKQIMEWRKDQQERSEATMYSVNLDWFARMWDTPDVAMCLGRY